MRSPAEIQSGLGWHKLLTDKENKMTKSPNVHYKYTKDDGTKIYGLGHWDPTNAQYTCKLDAEDRQLTGCFAEFAKKPIGSLPLEAAKKKARRLYGYTVVNHDG